jgi:hypothetical protein
MWEAKAPLFRGWPLCPIRRRGMEVDFPPPRTRISETDSEDESYRTNLEHITTSSNRLVSCSGDLPNVTYLNSA